MGRKARHGSALLMALCGLAVGGGVSGALLAAEAPAPSSAATAIRDGIDQAAINPQVNACENFYRHACGGFIAATPVTASNPEIIMADSRFDANLESALTRLFRETGDDPELDRLKTFYES